jgi:hypothetical protein
MYAIALRVTIKPTVRESFFPTIGPTFRVSEFSTF